ncbi:N-acetylglucosaminyl-phosphatidylinositol de-N-acetylase [Tulasnella sp. 419]|nr:N-acetylglucosaminyl-phosphatidylinositol de-N-acetylase [Tulasnella sp. 419]
MWNYLLLPIIFSSLWLPAPPSRFPGLGETGLPQKVLFLTAHPDDECMFFGPTILSMVSQGIEVHGISLSNGNADGLGSLREKEFQESYDTLGVPKENVSIMNHPYLQDNITSSWDTELISDILQAHVDKTGISAILTFDEAGISQHPNHISLYHGAKRYISSFDKADRQPPLLFALESVKIARKYTGLLAPISTRIILHVESAIRLLLMRLHYGPLPGPKMTIIANVNGFLTALQAMRRHKSQLVWFRWLYVLFSRYMWINDWVEVIPNVS